jgi:hypothetical protein
LIILRKYRSITSDGQFAEAAVEVTTPGSSDGSVAIKFPATVVHLFQDARREIDTILDTKVDWWALAERIAAMWYHLFENCVVEGGTPNYCQCFHVAVFENPPKILPIWDIDQGQWITLKQSNTDKVDLAGLDNELRQLGFPTLFVRV